MNNHCHFYGFNSFSSQKHLHRMFGHTEYMFGIGSLHFHFYYGSTSFNGHFHTFGGMTGFAIKTENGHKHKICGRLELANSHFHFYENYTHENVEYSNKRIMKRVLS